MATRLVHTAGSLPESIFESSPDSNLSANDYEDLWAYQGSLQGYTQLGTGRGSATVYFRRAAVPSGSTSTRRWIRTSSASPITPASATPPTTAGPRCWMRISSLSLRGGVDGSVNQVKHRHLLRLGEVRGRPVVTTQVESPIWDIAPFLMGD